MVRVPCSRDISRAEPYGAQLAEEQVVIGSGKLRY